MQRKTWGFVGAVSLQLFLLLLIVVPRWSILVHGKTVVLETLPYDPYDIFRGYYMDLRYRISDPDNLPEKTDFKAERKYYVILSPDGNGIWQPKTVSAELPKALKPDEAVIGGYYRYGWLDYGINRYYLPESRRHHVEELFRRSEKPVLVEIKVKDNGAAVVTQIIIDGKRFKY